MLTLSRERPNHSSVWTELATSNNPGRVHDETIEHVPLCFAAHSVAGEYAGRLTILRIAHRRQSWKLHCTQCGVQLGERFSREVLAPLDHVRCCHSQVAGGDSSQRICSNCDNAARDADD